MTISYKDTTKGEPLLKLVRPVFNLFSGVGQPSPFAASLGTGYLTSLPERERDTGLWPHPPPGTQTHLPCQTCPWPVIEGGSGAQVNKQCLVH